jgi:hypothetical protein
MRLWRWGFLSFLRSEGNRAWGMGNWLDGWIDTLGRTLKCVAFQK